MRIIKVERCGVQCPYAYDVYEKPNVGYDCGHPYVDLNTRFHVYEGKDFPDWCPLEKEMTKEMKRK